MTTIRGYVQSYTLGAGPLACAWVGPAPDDTELVFTTTMTGVLAQAQVTGEEVQVETVGDSAEVSSVATTACITAFDPLHLEGIEVTQAIQDLSQSVPLIAGKGTVVRVYLGNSTAAALTVRGELTVRQAPTDPVTVIPSADVALLDPADAGDLPAKRNELGRSLTFVLPATQTAEGPLVLALSAVVDDATGAPLGVACLRQPTVWFHNSPPLRVRVLGMRYTQTGTTFVPANLDFDLLASWLRRAYPVGQVVETRGIVTATPAPPFTSGQINAQLAAIRAIDVDSGEDNRTHYYGMVSDGGFFMRGAAAYVPVGSPDPATVSCGPTGPDTWGWDGDGSYGDWYGGHELAHTFGRKHPGFCGESQDDLDGYPHAGGALAGADDSTVGFDVGDELLGLPRAVLPGLEWKDVMTYCDQQWVSAYTYQGIRLRLLEENALGSAPVAGPLPVAAGPPAVPVGAGRPDGRVLDREPAPRPPGRVGPGPGGETPADPGSRAPGGGPGTISVVATVDPERAAGTIQFVHPVPNSRPTPAAPGSRYALRVAGPDGEVLAEVPVPVKVSSDADPAEDASGLVDAVLSVGARARTVELLVDGRPVDTVRAGDAPPGGAPAPVTREVSDAEIVLDLGRGLPAGSSYFVQVSEDGGRSWRTVGVGLRSARAVVDRDQFARGAAVRVRITATDGFTSTVLADETIGD